MISEPRTPLETVDVVDRPENVRGLPVLPENYVSRKRLAEIMDVDVSTIDRWRDRGMPSVKWGRRTRRFQPSQAVAWANQNALPDSSQQRKAA